MSPAIIFQLQLALGYVPWLLWLSAYGLPMIRRMDRVEAHRALTTLHSFRFFGLAFLVPGFVGADLPRDFALFAAYGDFATGVLAMLALATVRLRPLFWFFVVAFNLVGAIDILIDYFHGVQFDLPHQAGALGGAYAILMIYVPLLAITHALAFYLLLRRPAAAGAVGRTAASRV